MPVFFPFDNSYARFPDRFFTRTNPTPVRAPKLIRINEPLARQLSLDPDQLATPEGVEIFAGNRIPEGAEPIATAYAGHQFGGFVPKLGDGRAILLGEIIAKDGRRRDIQLKGAGRTPFSRGGDGRAALGPVLREYIVSEAMAALGIPTTRALAAVTTGEQVVREEMLPGAIFTRVASSHIRVGTFQFFASRQDVEGVRLLADHVIARHYSAAKDSSQPYLALLESVIRAQAELIASWLLIGFIHGVMNTDNMSVAGETIDYGPCAFLDHYDPRAVFSAIDQQGRYAYANQPVIGQWNLTRFAETLLPLLHENGETAVSQAEEALNAYPAIFDAAYKAGLRRKLGLNSEQDGDAELGQSLLATMAANRADFTLTFRRLSDAASDTAATAKVRELFADPTGFAEWEARWRTRLQEDSADSKARTANMRAANPAFIPRNHRVEAAIRAAVDCNNFAPFEELLNVVSKPYEDQPAFAQYAEPPQEHEIVHRTFCGT